LFKKSILFVLKEVRSKVSKMLDEGAFKSFEEYKKVKVLPLTELLLPHLFSLFMKNQQDILMDYSGSGLRDWFQEPLCLKLLNPSGQSQLEVWPAPHLLS